MDKRTDINTASFAYSVSLLRIRISGYPPGAGTKRQSIHTAVLHGIAVFFSEFPTQGKSGTVRQSDIQKAEFITGFINAAQSLRTAFGNINSTPTPDPAIVRVGGCLKVCNHSPNIIGGCHSLTRAAIQYPKQTCQSHPNCIGPFAECPRADGH